MTNQTYADDGYPPGYDANYDSYRPPDPPPVPIPAHLLASTIETLTRLDEFLRGYASRVALAELDAFCQAQGAFGGVGLVIDLIGLDLHGLHRAAHDHTHAHDHTQQQR